MKKPPKLATRLLLFFLRDDLIEEVLGDLEEDFYSEKSGFKARINYWYQVFNYMRPFALRKRTSNNTIHTGMLKNYFTIAWRNLIKHKMYSAINIGGFSLGIASCFLLALYIKGELSYDKFYSNKDRIYRVVRITNEGASDGRGVYFPHPMADVLRESFPEIEAAGGFNDSFYFGGGEGEIRRVDRLDNTHENGLAYMEQGTLDVLGLPFIAGNPSKALTAPNSMVITRSKAEKYFGDEDPMGKSFIINNEAERTYTVTGIIEDIPSQSHLHYDFIMTLEGKVFWNGERDAWCCSNYMDYVLVRPGTDVPSLEKKLSLIVENYMLPDAIKTGDDQGTIDWVKSMRFELQPIDDIYLNVADVKDNLNHGDIRYIWLFGSIATFILILAIINFINLSTARSASRAKEVGIRKVVGSMRSALIRQFLIESIVYSFISIALSVLIAAIAVRGFNLSMPWNEVWLVPVLIIASVLIGIMAGIYPSFYLSSFKPAKLRLDPGKKTTLRSVLVVFQFTISIILIVGTLVINKQMNFLLNTKLGFDKEQVLVLDGTRTLGHQVEPFKNELLQLADVRSATVTNYLPVAGGRRNGGDHKVEHADDKTSISGQHWGVDVDYIKTLGLKITKGRDFAPNMVSDSNAMIINETMAKKLNLADPVGQRIENTFGVFNVIGVVEDFHIASLKYEIDPVSMILRQNITAVAVKVQTTDMAATVENITTVWKKFSPHQPIRISFLDDRYASAYQDVLRFQFVITIFATLAIVVACLGLFGLSSFMIEQRGKEISIRMVLGASVSHILRLLSQSFVMLVTIAFVVATPAAWMMMNKWLEDYAYKIDITWEIFMVTGVTAIAIALLTIGYQSMKAALASPVQNLKSE